MKKIILITEIFNPPFDEGIKKSIFNIYKKLVKKFNVLVICRYGYSSYNIFEIKTNRLFISKKIHKIFKKFNPDFVIYSPFQSATFASFIRLKIISTYKKNIKVGMIALQPKPHGFIQSFIIKFIKPMMVFTPSLQLKNFLDRNRINVKMITLYTDLNKFKVLDDAKQKLLLKKKYGIINNKKIITHVGHIRESRNLESLIELQAKGYQVLIVSSSSTPDLNKKEVLNNHLNLKKKLKSSGIVIIDYYVPNINEIYQLSDIYIFPVLKVNASIDLPLSVLEARACGIPCVCTDFGSLKFFLKNDNFGITYSKDSEFLINIKKILKSKRNYYKSDVRRLNEKFLSEIIEFFKN